ncbi:sensor histidine kinase [Actinoplanes sp. NPDC020271]|uniref:sensor histidine kinase n=1 Tax=Actinoplanes sp. NPDC020271 TaxID=3363896 RepID=UPI0037A5216A
MDPRRAGRRAEGARAPQPTLADLAGLVDQVAQVGSTSVTLSARGRPGAVPPGAEVAAYRIVQEALTNVLKHARAKTVTVTVDWSGDELALTVPDDGRGPQRTDGKGHGIVGIRERAAGRRRWP